MEMDMQKWVYRETIYIYSIKFMEKWSSIISQAHMIDYIDRTLTIKSMSIQSWSLGIHYSTPLENFKHSKKPTNRLEA